MKRKRQEIVSKAPIEEYITQNVLMDILLKAKVRVQTPDGKKVIVLEYDEHRVLKPHPSPAAVLPAFGPSSLSGHKCLVCGNGLHPE
jgi:hypothetical protein